MLAKHGVILQFCALIGLLAATVGCPQAPNQVALLVAPETLDFGLTKNSMTFTVRKSLSSPRLPAFTATVDENSRGWITVTPGEGTSTGPNDSFRFTVTLDRQGLAAGDNTGSIVIASPGSIVPRTVTVKARALVAADFSAEPLDPFARFTEVKFTDKSAAAPEHATGIDTWLWEFGDGQTSALKDPVHIYDAVGTYTVRLTVTSKGVTDTETKTAYVTSKQFAGPVANFTFAPATGILANSPVQFTDTSEAGTAPITKWEWDFGDGSTGAEKNPAHSYADGGQKTVTLVVTTAHGVSAPVSKSFAVGTTLPTVDFTADDTTPVFGTPVQFTNLSVKGTAEITRYLWNFGDGNSSEAVNPAHTYAPANDQRVFTVTLTAFSAHGNATATKTDYITVQTINPTADFSANPLEAYVGNPVTFTDLSQNGTATIEQWLWNFGDGGTSATTSPVHVYQAPGTYTVSLTVTSDHGSHTAQKAAYVKVVPRRAPDPNFTYSPANPYEMDEVQFTDTSDPGSSPITAWAWNFGDGGTSTQKNPIHVFQTAQTYTVRLTTTSNDGTDTVERQVMVRPNVDPVADFTADKVRPLLDEVVQFTDVSNPGTAPITEWEWDFGDGTPKAAIQNPTHSFARAGKTVVSLKVTSRHGTHTVSKPDYVTVLPDIDFSADPANAFVGKAVRFTDLTKTGGATITSWLWDFGDGLTSAEQNPVHTFGRVGEFDVSLTVTLADGTTHTVTKSAFMKAEVQLPQPNFEASNWNPLFYEQINFMDTSEPGSAPINRWAWEFGNGGTSTAKNPTYVYQPYQDGLVVYTVKLTVWTPYTTDQGVSITKDITVGHSNPVAQFTQDKSIITMGDTVTFRSTSYIEGGGRLMEQRWMVWQGDPAAVPEPEWNYAASFNPIYTASPNLSYRQYPFHEAGRYHVALRVFSSVLTNPGNPDDPGNTPAYESSILVKANAIEVRERSSLDSFVRTPANDSTYNYQLLSKQAGTGYTQYVLRVISQAWSVYVPSAPSPAVWQHDMTIYQPEPRTNNMVLLYLDSGKEPVPADGKTPKQRMIDFAKATGSIVAVLENVPNQPIRYPHLNNEPLSDDRLLAASYDAFLGIAWPPFTAPGDDAQARARTSALQAMPNVLAPYPMVKSVTRAMDSIQRLFADPRTSGVFPAIFLDGFVVAGGSPDGWSLGWVTWLVGATDPRVKGIVPFSFDALNIHWQFIHQYYTLGYFPEALADYTQPWPTGFELPLYWNPEDTVDSALQWKHWLRKLQRVQRLILEDLRDDRFFPPVTDDNDTAHLQDLRDFLDKDDSPYELRDALPTGGIYTYASGLVNTMITAIDTLKDNMPDTKEGKRQAMLAFVGDVIHRYASGSTENGSTGALGRALLNLYYLELQNDPASWLLYMIDPIWYNDPYTLALEYYSEYGERLRMPKYLINSPADSFSSPDASSVYYGYVAQSKLLRLVASDAYQEERTLGGFAPFMMELIPWYKRVVSGVAMPRLEWQFLADDQLRVNAGSLPAGTTWKLWTAESATGADFRMDPVYNPNPPDWTSVALAPANGAIFVQIPATLDTYTAYFVEATIKASDGDFVVTTDCRIVPPYESPYGKAVEDADGAAAE